MQLQTPVIHAIGNIAIIYDSITTSSPADEEKILLTLLQQIKTMSLLEQFRLNSQGVEGSVLLMIGGGFVS